MELVVGSIVSLIVGWLKKQFGTEEWKTLGVLAVLSLVAAWGYTYLNAVGYWETVLNVIISAGAFYAFVLSRFK